MRTRSAIRTLVPRMDTNDKLNSNGNGFAFRLPIDIRVIEYSVANADILQQMLH